MSSASPEAPSRRSFLAGAGGAVGAVGAAAALAGCSAASDTTVVGVEVGAHPVHPVRFVDFFGDTQPGITAAPVPALGLMAAFRCVARDEEGLRACLRDLSDEIRTLMSGEPITTRDEAYPPADSGVLGLTPPADNLSIVVSVGASLFDDRFGLADRKPRELVEMPYLANDRLDPERSHGDVLVTLEAEHPDTLLFAIRQLMRRTRDSLVLAWLVDGYTRGTSPAVGAGAPRNLMGFKDGTSNLAADDSDVMSRYVWLNADDVDAGEPEWARNGSYQAVRMIRMLVEFWDRTRLSEQEAIMGRHKVSGAPLGGDAEDEAPDYSDDPNGARTPLDAHIRLANPRTAATADSLMFRRGFSYSRGFDRAGQLDQGLAFVSYQRSLERGFLAVQARLNGEPLEEYIRPEGGGFFFALPGVTDSDGFLGEGLFA